MTSFLTLAIEELPGFLCAGFLCVLACFNAAGQTLPSTWLDALAQDSTANQIHALPPGQTIDREMTAAETHRYKFDLQANEFFQVRVEQKGFVEGMTARGQEGQAEIATSRLSQAQAGWEELKDDYMAGLTVAAQLGIISQELNNELQTAQKALQEGQQLSTKSNADSLSARAKLTQALAMFRALNEKLTDKALLDKVSQSGPTSQQTLNYFKTLHFVARSGEGLSLSGIAQTHYNLGEWQEYIDYQKLSVAVYEDALKSFSDLSTGANLKAYLLALRSNEAGVLVNIGQTLKDRLGRREEALDYFTQALERFRALAQETQEPQFKLQEALTLMNIGLLHTDDSRGRQTGIQFLWKAVDVYRTFPDRKREIARLLELIGGQHSVDLDYVAAIKNWEDASKIYRELEDSIGQMSVFQAEGTMYSLLGNKTKVHEMFGQVLSILQSPDFAEQFKRNYPELQSIAGFGAANERVSTFIEETRLDRIGFAYERLEDYERAIESYQKALAVARSLKEPRDVHGDLTSIGFDYTKLEKWDQAHEYYLQALDISRSRGVKEDVADDLTDVGRALMESRKPQEALIYQNEALALYQSVGIDGKKVLSLRYTRLLNELARTNDALGSRRLAIFYGKQGVNAIQDERQRLRNFDAESQKGFLGKEEKHYRRLADWLIAEGRLPEAEQVLQMLKEEEVSDYLRRDKSIADKLSLRVDFTAAEAKALKSYEENSQTISTLGAELGKFEESKKNGAQLTPEQKKCFDELKTKLSAANADFEKFLDQLAAGFKQGKNPAGEINEDTGLQSDMQGWGGDLAFIYTLVGEARYSTILITPKARVSGEKEIKAVDLDRKIFEFREQVKNPKVDPRPLGKELYDILIKPIEKELEGAKAKTLLWSLDGNLRLLPMAALWDGRQYFGQKYQNVVITLASRTRIGREVSATPNVLGLGVSEAQTARDTLGERNLLFSSLPSVPLELASIVRSKQSPKGVLPGESLLNSLFTEKALEEQLAKGYKVVHIASHFSLNPGDASRSFLLLGDGTTLTVNDLKNNPSLTLAGVELLTLSACDTAVGERDGSGKEVDGFAYVAQERGARSIIATLWPVADASTSLLMREFYRLRQEHPGMTKAEALQLAQKEMIEGKLQPASRANQERSTQRVDAADSSNQTFAYDPKKPYAHPYFWSPFVLIGNWR